MNKPVAKNSIFYEVTLGTPDWTLIAKRKGVYFCYVCRFSF